MNKSKIISKSAVTDTYYDNLPYSFYTGFMESYLICNEFVMAALGKRVEKINVSISLRRLRGGKSVYVYWDDQEKQMKWGYDQENWDDMYLGMEKFLLELEPDLLDNKIRKVYFSITEVECFFC